MEQIESFVLYMTEGNTVYYRLPEYLKDDLETMGNKAEIEETLHQGLLILGVF